MKYNIGAALTNTEQHYIPRCCGHLEWHLQCSTLRWKTYRARL